MVEMVDTNNDGVADNRFSVLTGLKAVHGLVFSE